MVVRDPVPVRTPFGFGSTAGEIVAGVDLAGKRIIVTGAASGIGVATARALAAAGADVTLAVRSIDAGSRVAAAIRHETGNANVRAGRLDLADQGSVTAFAAAWQGPLHVLINNAGIMALPALERTQEGWEQQFATNHFGHFALTTRLHRALAEANGARVVLVSSSAHLLSPVMFDDPHFLFLPYDPFMAYGQSKTAGVLLAVALTRRWLDDGIVANALNPGAIATRLQKHTGGLKTPPERRKNVDQGAATSVLLAAHPQLDGIGGRYFEDCNEAMIVTQRSTDFRGVASYAVDPENAERLWQLSQRLIS